MSYIAEREIDHGCKWPYDQTRGPVEPQPYLGRDRARRAVLGILSNLGDRRGIKWALDDVDHEVRGEIVETLTEIVRTAYGEAK